MNIHFNRKIVLFSLFLLFSILPSCKASPAKNAGFANPTGKMVDVSEVVPFHKGWRRPDFKKENYHSIIIAPVNTQHLLQMGWWKQTNYRNKRGKYEQDLQNLASYTHKSLSQAFSSDKSHHIRLTDIPGPGTLVLEFAIVEVVPSKVALNAAGLAVMATGLGVAAKIALRSSSKFPNKSSIAFEARIRDSITGEVLAVVADREQQKASIVNIKDLSWYGHIKSIIDEWAQQFVAAANRKEGEKVKDSSAFRLLPW